MVFGNNPKTILPEYNCNQDLVFWEAKNQIGFSIQDKLKDFTFADCLEFLWNDNIKKSRLVAYGIANLTEMASNPLVRYCLIRVIEELGNTFFLVSHNCTEGVIESNYFGNVHLGFEPGYLHGCDPEKFESQTLTAEEA